MRWLDRLLPRRRRERELDEEIRAHLEERADAFMANGMSREEALAAARRAFGNVTAIAESSREVWHWPALESLRADLRYALRLVRRYPAFSANVIAIAALGIAACAATFSLVSGILLSPLPFASPDRVFELLMETPDGRQTAAVPVEVYHQLAADTAVLDAIAASRPARVTVEWNGQPEHFNSRVITPSFFRVFGVVPALGRPFAGDESERSPVVLLGNGLWRRRFNADSGIVGQRVSIEGSTYTVIGVMPPRFRAWFTEEPDLWQPWSVPTAPGADVNAVFRTADGVSRERAAAWLAATITARVFSYTSGDSVSASPVIVPIVERIVGEVERPLQVLLGAVLLVLLLVAANVATLFLARSSARARELGVRRALGASRARQVQQLLAESLTLTVLGGVAGVLGSYWIIGTIRGLGLDLLPRMDRVALDGRVLGFAVLATVLTGVVGGLAPVLRVRHEPRVDASGTRVSGGRLSAGLVVAQITLSVVLLVGAGLLVKSFVRVLPDDPGFATENRATVLTSLAGLPEYPDTDRVGARRFVAEVSARLRAVSGVQDVAAMSFAPFFGSAFRIDVRLPGRPEPDRPLYAFQNHVTTNFFDVMQIPFRRGRPFHDGDREGTEPVAIVNETAAARWWPGEDALGQQLVTSWPGGQSTVTVVGVARDARMFGYDTRARPEIYVPVAQTNPRFVTFIVHTTRDPNVVAPELHRAVWSVAPRLPIGHSSDLASIALRSVRRPRFFAWALGTFAAIAVTLSALALYSLLTLDVVQRRNEIGVRVAMGATGGRIGALILRRALTLGAVGVAVGVIVARAASRVLEDQLLEVSATDGTVFAGMAAAALALAIVAALAPVRRAVRVDPVECLKT